MLLLVNNESECLFLNPFQVCDNRKASISIAYVNNIKEGRVQSKRDKNVVFLFLVVETSTEQHPPAFKGNIVYSLILLYFLHYQRRMIVLEVE